MYTTILAFAGAASAAAIAQRQAAPSKCCFGINVSGGVADGGLGQFTDGQNRVGPGYGGAEYCYYAADQSIVDASGRGCVISGPTSQYQCDAGVTAATAASGITIAANSSIEHNGNAIWYECYSTAAQGVYNIYANNPGSAALDCHPITLTTVNSNCTQASASASSSAAASTSSAQTSSVAPVSSSAAASTSSAQTSSVAPVSSSSAAPTTSVLTNTLVSTVRVSSSTAAASTCVASTVTLPAPAASTVTLPAPAASTVTLPAPAASTVTLPAPAASTVTLPAPAASTVTLPAPAASTVTLPAPAAMTVTVQPSCPAAPACTPVAPSSAPAVSSPVASSSAPAVSSPAASSSVGASSSIVTSTVARTSTVVVPASSAPASSAPASSAPASSAPASSAPASSASVAPPAPAASACPATIAGQSFQYPHLIVPVNKNSPNTAYGTQYFAGVNSTYSTIFNFDIPASYAGKQCSLEMLLPNKKDLVTSDYTMSGSGNIDFQQLAAPASQSTTYATQPKVAKDLGVFPITPGSATIVASGPCAAGMTVSYELVAQDSTALYFFEDYNPAALGLFIVAC